MRVSMQNSSCGFYLGLPSEVALGHVVSIFTGTLSMGRIKLWALGWRWPGVTEQVWDQQPTAQGLSQSLPPPTCVTLVCHLSSVSLIFFHHKGVRLDYSWSLLEYSDSLQVPNKSHLKLGVVCLLDSITCLFFKLFHMEGSLFFFRARNVSPAFSYS